MHLMLQRGCASEEAAAELAALAEHSALSPVVLQASVDERCYLVQAQS